MTWSLTLWVAVQFGARVLAAYDDYHFTTEASQWRCPGMIFQCTAPSICAYNSLTDQYHCCDTGADDAVCWNNNTPCEGGDNYTPGPNQIGCSSGANAFCCLKHREECTQRYNQVNVCWEMADDPFRNVSQIKMNETFSSLSSDNPSATTLAVPNFTIFVDTTASLPYQSSASSLSPSTILSALLASTPASVPESQSLPATTDVPTPSPTPSPTTGTSTNASGEPNSDNTVSAGIIGGAVVGAIAGVAFLSGLALFLSKRRNASGSTTKPSELESRDGQNPYVTNQIHHHAIVHEKYASGVAVQAYTEYPLQEMPADHRPSEMDGTGLQQEKMPSSFL